ncbi:MAG: lipoyl(octanoyl) transferase, partial [Candidatus Schekmanbacteria bacterium]
TLGRRGKKENLLVEESFLKEKGIGLYNVERGGDITYHGPGQVVGYPILNLNQNRDIHKLVRSVEDVLIKVIRLYGIDGKRIKGLTGVWVGNEKIAAIGMAVKKWISFHGFALNVSTNLDYFKYIRPCGIDDKGVTSIERILGKNSPSIEDVERDIIEQFGEVFGFAMKRGFEFIGKEL